MFFIYPLEKYLRTRKRNDFDNWFIVAIFHDASLYMYYKRAVRHEKLARKTFVSMHYKKRTYL